MKKIKLLSKTLITIGCAFSIQFGFSQDIALKTDSTESILKPSPKVPEQKNNGTEKRDVFTLNSKTDIPITIGCTAWSGYAMTKIYNKGASSEAQILSLNRNDINPLDRSAIYGYSSSLDKFSYIPFYAAIPLPLVFFLTGNDMRSDYLKLTFLYFETLSVTGLFGYSATYFENKYRPYVYDPNTSLSTKMGENAKNSFYAGHVEIIATSTFFISQVYASYYPESKVKWVFYGLAGVSTAGMGYLRLKAGEHFLSDIFMGGMAGALSGMLVPYFHSHKIIKNKDLSLSPFKSGSTNGLSMVYRLSK